jgi:replicative DNA helicase
MNTPPSYNTTAEAGIIGCLLWDGASCYHEARASGLKSDWFHDIRNVEIYRAVEALELSGTPATFHTVKNRMGPALEQSGGVSYLIELSRNSSPSPEMLPIFLEEARAALLRRKAASIASEASDLAGGDVDGEELLLSMSAKAVEAVDSVSQRESAHGTQLAARFTTDLEKRKELADSGRRSGIPTGFRDLDRMRTIHHRRATRHRQNGFRDLPRGGNLTYPIHSDPHHFVRNVHRVSNHPTLLRSHRCLIGRPEEGSVSGIGHAENHRLQRQAGEGPALRC